MLALVQSVMKIARAVDGLVIQLFYNITCLQAGLVGKAAGTDICHKRSRLVPYSQFSPPARSDIINPDSKIAFRGTTAQSLFLFIHLRNCNFDIDYFAVPDEPGINSPADRYAGNIPRKIRHIFYAFAVERSDHITSFYACSVSRSPRHNITYQCPIGPF